MGALQALEEMGVKPDVIAGASIGALVGGAWILDELDALMAWAEALSPLNAFQNFDVMLNRGGLVKADKAFDIFRNKDKNIEDLPIAFGASAVDLATGKETWLTKGSLIDAAQASAAIPVLFHAVERDGRWLVDGALANPMPVNLARALGADLVIAVDLLAYPRVLDRFNPPPASPPALRPQQERSDSGVFPEAVTQFISDTRAYVDEQIAFAKARAKAKPQLFETAMATAEIFQANLTAARVQSEPPDIHIKPRVRDSLPTALDKADEYIEEGYRATMALRRDIETAIETALAKG